MKAHENSTFKNSLFCLRLLCKVILLFVVTVLLLQGLRANWAMLSKAEKNNLVSRALTANGASALKCLNLDCSEMINEFEDIVSHVDSCWEYPEYFTYMVISLSSCVHHGNFCNSLQTCFPTFLGCDEDN